MPEILKAVAYARYSSHMQREESITAQLRAIEKFVTDNGYVLLDSYIDEAQSAKTDDRIAFQRLISDIKTKRIEIDAVIVHKGDRFARNRYDAAIYKNFLKQNNIRFISVTENLQDNPESVILESVLEGMAEYYSLNLQREVRKGLKENALSAKATGGKPPLGYNINRETMKLEINEVEAQAVKLIYKMYLDGCGYTEIINKLNSCGYKTKRGMEFGKNSINSILKNVKYTGLYTYNLVAPKYKGSGKPIRYSRADSDNLIQLEGAVPQIISKENFDAVQSKMKARQHRSGQFNARANYLLSGKIFCGDCGAPYTGNKRKKTDSHPEYISYRCSKRNGKNKKCTNKEIRKEIVEQAVLDKISNVIFDESIIEKIYKKINSYILEKEENMILSKSYSEKKLKEISKQIDNLVNVIADTGSKAVIDKLDSLEREKIVIQNKIRSDEAELAKRAISLTTLKQLFHTAKNLFEKGTLDDSKRLIDMFVDSVYIYQDQIEIKINIMDNAIISNAHGDVFHNEHYLFENKS